MKQRKHNDKRRNTDYIKYNQTAPSAVYKRIKRSTKDYQKSNYDNQTNNKDRVTDMSIGLEEQKKSKPKKVDQKEEKPSSPLRTSSSTLEPEVIDSSKDNAMSEMKEVAVMGPDNASKVFSHVEEKQQLDPSTTSINDSIKKAIPENKPNTNPAMTNPTLEERDGSAMELKVDVLVPKQDVKPDTPQVHKESEKGDQLGESVRFYDDDNKVSYSNLSNNDNNNPFIFGIKFWQAHNIAWINTYNEFMKAWIDNVKTDSNN